MSTPKAHKLESEAHLFATERHAGQLRKWTNEPYIVHLERVAELVRSVPHSSEMIAAAYLHDVLEDTTTTREEIRERFGDDVDWLVYRLSNISKPSDGNRAARKKIDRDWIAGALYDVQTIKAADIIDNVRGIIEASESHKQVRRSAVMYLAEKLEVLHVLTLANVKLVKIARDLIVGRKAESGVR